MAFMSILQINEMKHLWKQVFHDSDQYISRIFNHWVDSDYSSVRTGPGGELIAMLCAHRFCFTGNMQGLYLHGLATRDDFRRQGIMTSLLYDCINQAKESNLDFLFLIPADDGLRSYYSRFGFLDLAPRRFISCKEYDRDIRMQLTDRSMDVSDLPTVIDLWRGFVQRQSPGVILHSEEDAEAVIEEWIESEGEVSFLADGSVCFSRQGCIEAIFNDEERCLCEMHGYDELSLYPSQEKFFHTDELSTKPYAMILPISGDMPSQFCVNLLMD